MESLEKTLKQTELKLSGHERRRRIEERILDRYIEELEQEEFIQKNKITIRMSVIDGEPQFGTDDENFKRINVVVVTKQIKAQKWHLIVGFRDWS